MKRPSNLTAPYLKRISLLEEKADKDVFPFNRLPFLTRPGFSLDFPQRVTFFVGENGSGKSTLLEAIAAICEFPTEGGRRKRTDPAVGWPRRCGRHGCRG